MSSPHPPRKWFMDIVDNATKKTEEELKVFRMKAEIEALKRRISALEEVTANRLRALEVKMEIRRPKQQTTPRAQ